MVRSLLGSQQLGLKYSPLGGDSGSPGRATEERFASTEDFFGAEEFKRPATMPESTWCDLTRIIFTTIFMGIGVNFKWLTSKVAFGDAKALIDRLKQHVGNKDAQMARLNTRFAELNLLSAEHYFSWFGEFMDLVDNWNDIPGIGNDVLSAAKIRTKYLDGINSVFSHIVTHADMHPDMTVDDLHKLVEQAINRKGISIHNNYTHTNPSNPTTEVPNNQIANNAVNTDWQTFHGDSDSGYVHENGYSNSCQHRESDAGDWGSSPFSAAMLSYNLVQWGSKGKGKGYNRFNAPQRFWRRAKGKGKGKGKGTNYIVFPIHVDDKISEVDCRSRGD